MTDYQYKVQFRIGEGEWLFAWDDVFPHRDAAMRLLKLQKRKTDTYVSNITYRIVHRAITYGDWAPGKGKGDFHE